MQKVRVAHLADFHLGAEINEKNKLSEQINKNLIRSLVEILNMISAAKVQLVLIAGDFYESSNIDKNLKNQIKEIFSKFNGKIVISPGNHDYISLESVYHEKWPQNTYIFKDEMVDYFQFDELNTRVYGFAFTKSHINKHMILDVIDVDDTYINIGLFHGQIDNVDNIYHPIFLSDIENSGLDYVALGHVHKRSEIKKIGNTYYAYSGNPVGRGFDETGEKGLYLGDISKDRMGLNFYKIDNSEFHIVNFEVKDFENQTDLSSQIENHLKEIFIHYKKHYYKIILNGYLKKDQIVNTDIIEANLSDINYIEIVNNTKIFVDYESISREDNLKGRFVKNVLNEIHSTEDREKILDIGIRAFEDLL